MTRSRLPRYLVITVHTPFDTLATAHLQLYTFYAEHRDIAFELAMQFGRETCFGRKFEGLAHLGVTEKRVVRVWKEERGEPDDFVVPKNRLDAFSKHWFVRRCKDSLFKERTNEPPFQMELEHLDRIPWYKLEHAYGNAFDVPKEIRRLTSTDCETQLAALERLCGTIYHQGSIFPATVPAVAALLEILANTSLANRDRIAQLFMHIAESSFVTAKQIREKWAQLASLPYPPDDHSEREIEERLDVRNEIESHFSEISDLALDSDSPVAETFRRVVELVSPSRTR
jgi:hypothetical protein